MKKTLLTTLSLITGFAYGIPSLQELAAQAAIELPATPEVIGKTLVQAHAVDAGKAPDWLKIMPEKVLTLLRDATNKLFATSIKQISLQGDTINALAYSPDGSKLACALSTNVIQLYDTRTGMCTRQLKKHTSFISAIAFSPNGSHLVSASYDGTLIIWDLASGNYKKRLKPKPFNWITAVAYAHDSKHIASGSQNGTITIWNSSSGSCIQTYRAHPQAITSLSFQPNQPYCVSTSEDGTVKIWDTQSNECIQTCTHATPVKSAVYNPQESQIITGHGSTITIWDMRTGKQLQELIGHKKSVQSVSYSQDCSRIISGSLDATKVWDTQSGACLLTLPNPQNALRPRICSHNKSLAVAVGDTITIFTLSTVRTPTRLTDYYALKFLMRPNFSSIAPIWPAIATTGPEATSCFLALLENKGIYKESP